MAKRPARSQADEVTPQSPSTKPRGRGREQREIGPDAVTGSEPDAVNPNTLTAGPETISEELDAASRVRRVEGGRAEVQPTHEEIRARAYEMYLERGARDGMDFDDWVTAERELRARR
jgi:hypothetical protein